MHWKRTNVIEGTSEVDIEWTPPQFSEQKEFRIKYFGDAKGLNGKIKPFEGITKSFLYKPKINYFHF